MTIPKKGAAKIVRKPRKLTRYDPINERIAAMRGARM
jgi:hypothetical protein